MKKLLLVISLFTFSILAKAQEQKGTIIGTLIDSASSKPIVYATISIFKANDTTLVSYRLSDEKGEFRIPLLPVATQLRIIVTYTGFSVYRKVFQVNAGQPQLDLGKILIKTSSINLNEVTIRAERPPVIVRKDTIEFNAAAFKTLPDALVEDLLRKLPGVNVDKDGNILVNGRRVSTIYVDGKEFFGGDVRIASKNLPANTIEKVQVMNDAEALRFNPLMAEADIPQVINLKLKPGIKKGVFGKIYAGGGFKNKAEAGALLNLFRDTTQLSILGYGNNLNKSAFAFTDLRSVGGFGRSGWGNANGNGNGGLSIDKVSFGGFGSGLMNSSGGGGNFNTIFKKNVQFSVNYFYGAVTSDYDEVRNSQQNLNETVFNTRQNMTQTASNYAHMIGTKVAFDLSPKLRFEIRPQIVFSNDETEQVFKINSSSNKNGLLSETVNNQQNQNNGTTFLMWTKLISVSKKKGRAVDLFNYTSIDDSKTNLFNQANNVFYQPPGTSLLDQLRRSDTKNSNSTTYFKYTDLLNEKLTTSSTLNVSYFDNINDIGTFLPDLSQQYDVIVPALSDNYRRKGFKTDASTTLRWKSKKFSIAPGFGLSSYIANNTFNSAASIHQDFLFFLPALDVTSGIFNLSYQTSYREPTLANLQPVVNNTNPLNIRQGNPTLKPSYNNTLSLGLRKFDTKRSMTYNVNFSGMTTKNATIISRTIDASGVQTTLPINANGTWGLSNNLSFQKDWKLANNRQISIIASNSSSLNESIVLLNQAKSDFSTLSIRPSAELRINLNDKLEVNQSYTFSHYRNEYDSDKFTDQSLTYHDSRSELIFRIADRLVWETQLDYRYNSDATPGLLKNYYKWNAAVTYIFLKGRRGQLKFAVNDILDQNILASRFVYANSIEDMQGSTIRRYGLVTFTYNIRNFGEKIGGRNQLFRF